jgi:hypothetical protein
MRVSKPYHITPADAPLFVNFRDFTKEVIPPGESKEFPDGLVSLHVDDDFWIAAVIPYKYRNNSTEILVRSLWPSFGDDFEVRPDHVSKPTIEVKKKKKKKSKKTPTSE